MGLHLEFKPLSSAVRGGFKPTECIILSSSSKTIHIDDDVRSAVKSAIKYSLLAKNDDVMVSEIPSAAQCLHDLAYLKIINHYRCLNRNPNGPTKFEFTKCDDAFGFYQCSPVYELH